MGRLEYLKTIKFNETSFKRVYHSLKVRLLDLPHRIAWEFPTDLSLENKQKLLSYKNIHKGERCFVIANGPSLIKMDLSLLKNDITIGMNRIYLLKDINNFFPTYLVVTDNDIQLKQFSDDLNNLKLVRFFNWNSRKLFDKNDSLLYIKERYKVFFSTDITKHIWGGHSVTYACLQIAYFMGFSEVVLIGKDHSYHGEGVPNQWVQCTDNKSNHFINGYYKIGMGWRIPDYKGEELAYKMAKDVFEKDGRIILDATIGGKLQVFKKVNFKSLFIKNKS